MKLIINRVFNKILVAKKSLLIFIVVLQTSFLSFITPDLLPGVIAIFCVVFIIWSNLGSRFANIYNPIREMRKDMIFNNILVSGGLAFLVTPLPFLFWLSWPIGTAFAIAISLAAAPMAIRQLLAILFNRRIRNESEQSYLEIAPPVVLYISGLSKVAYQVNQWLPVLEALPIKIVVIVRNIKIFSEMNPTKLPVFYARDGKSTEWLLNNSPRIVLYPNNRMMNVNPLRFSHLIHIFINHGESDKSVNQSKMLMAYDYLFVGGILAGKRLAKAGLPVREGQLVTVGRPQAEILLTEDHSKKPIRNVLYAPTWEGGVEATDYSSVGSFSIEMLELLATRIDLKVKVKPHPMTGSVSSIARNAMQQMRKISSREPNIELVDQTEAIHDAMNWSDMMITDVSAVLTDYLVTGKPVALCGNFSRGRSPAELTEEFPLLEATYLIKIPDDIVDLLTTLSDRDPRRKDRERIRREAIGEPGAVERFEHKLLDILATDANRKKIV
jgi:CDP-glycerol glycerophosphotransferase (TagB/SpsB family)